MNSNNKKIKIAHLIKDEKFFETSAKFYDELENVDNQYFLYSRKKDYEFKYIKSKEKVTRFSNYISYIKAIRKSDIVRFHSFLSLDYLTLLFTSSRQKVIWWAWGYDIYDEFNGMPPLVHIDLYKPLTNNYVLRNKKHSLIKRIKKLFIGTILNCIRRIGMPKIDYMVPCIPMDYELVREQCPYFHAKLFPIALRQNECQFTYKENVGNILIGNSSTYTNNHLDIFEKLYGQIPSGGAKCIIPINYGTAFNKGDDLIKLSHFKDDEVIWLRSFMDRNSYFNMINSVTHAIFGVLRQQALGNIYYCLRTGVKVYLYDDSIVAKQLKRDGYIFFSIDTELTCESLSAPLSKEQAYHNIEIYNKRYVGCTLTDIQKALKLAASSEKA